MAGQTAKGRAGMSDVAQWDEARHSISAVICAHQRRRWKSVDPIELIKERHLFSERAVYSERTEKNARSVSLGVASCHKVTHKTRK